MLLVYAGGGIQVCKRASEPVPLLDES